MSRQRVGYRMTKARNERFTTGSLVSGKARSSTGRYASNLWAITCYFNPIGYQRRLENYHTFRQNLAVPLVTVELAFNGAFQLHSGDADILVQLRGGDVLWQKERL